MREVPFVLALTCSFVLHGCRTAMPPSMSMPDTAPHVAQTEAEAALRVWHQYDSTFRATNGANHSPFLWSEMDRSRWPMVDLVGLYLSPAVEPRVLKIARVVIGRSEHLELVVQYRDTTVTDTLWSASVSRTVFLVNERGAWKLTNPLLRNLRSWDSRLEGKIRFTYEPGTAVRLERARAAVVFVDSLADAFDLPRVDSLTYVVTSGRDAVYRALGVVSAVSISSEGGLAQPVNHLVLSGAPTVGEYYRHELAHIVLRPLIGARTLYVISEGVPTWLGGTGGLDFVESVRRLRPFLIERPTADLDSLLSGRGIDATLTYAASAELVAMAHEVGGADAVRRLFRAGPSLRELRYELESQLGQPWTSISKTWRDRVLGR